MSRLVDAVIRKLEYINRVEYRPASYDDLKFIEIEGKLCEIDYGTLRNIISVLKKEGRIERYYNSKVSFFVLKGVKFGRHRAKQEMIDNSASQLSKTIQQLPKNNRGLHDIHTSFQVQDFWTILSESKRFKVNGHNKGILLPHFNIDGLKITAIIYHTDTVTVTVACSKNPVSTSIDDVNGVIRLATELAKTQERMQRIVDECGQSLPGGYENILIPDSDTWIIKMWHFAVDSPNYREENICMTWKDAQGVLLREYNKKKEGKLRKERQEYPNTSLAQVCRNFLQDTGANGPDESLKGIEDLNSS